MKLFSNRQYKTVEIGGGTHKVSIPSEYLFQYNDKGTLIFYSPGKETISIRISVISFDTKSKVDNAGYLSVVNDAKSKNLKYQTFHKDFNVLELDPYVTTEDKTDLIIQVWNIGSKNNIIIVSSTIIKDLSASRHVKDMKKDLPKILKSIRET